VVSDLLVNSWVTAGQN